MRKEHTFIAYYHFSSLLQIAQFVFSIMLYLNSYPSTGCPLYENANQPGRKLQ